MKHNYFDTNQTQPSNKKIPAFTGMTIILIYLCSLNIDCDFQRFKFKHTIIQRFR
jgi:hypothetical protein